ncbi:MAG: hypothetical protein WBV47_08620 [Salegentibacter sp.]
MRRAMLLPVLILLMLISITGCRESERMKVSRKVEIHSDRNENRDTILKKTAEKVHREASKKITDEVKEIEKNP